MSIGSDPGSLSPRNDATIIGYPQRRLFEPWAFERLFHEHFAFLDRERHVPEENGYLVVAVHGNSRVTGSLFVPAERPACGTAVVLGRHARADLVLREDPSVALRHALLRVSADEEGLPTARLIDLHTGQGMRVEKAGRCESVASDGALLLRLGSYALFLLPAGFDLDPWGPDPAEAWCELDDVSLRDARAARLVSEVLAVPRFHAPNPDRPGRKRADTQITLLPALTDLRAHRGNEPMPPETIGVVTLLTGTLETIYPVTRAQVERGALLGRYERCTLRTAGAVDHSAISRVHAVLLADGDDILLIDTASTNGTQLDDTEVRIAPLPDEAVVDLAGEVRAIWQRLRR